MDENLEEAHEELKRLEHILYVSLKYTRTVDVLINALKRLLNIYDLIIEAFLEKAKAEDLIKVLPKSPGLRSTKLRDLYPDEAILQNHLHFYLFIRNVLNSPYTKRREYRRHVTLIVERDDHTVEVDSDNLINCERFAHKFFNYALERIEGITDED
ncbi:MAG: hypothetical protein KKH52_02145 [Nanoarchaeota archaeon]|nr:hypothetical protein [Nanoarchaeota archaeon]MBU1623087.1 hypothetical protein [Nanoarchaeota archaeon]MBU1974173.1 hypothetical protein [Nanoarchaeota archaeon]